MSGSRWISTNISYLQNFTAYPVITSTPPSLFFLARLVLVYPVIVPPSFPWIEGIRQRVIGALGRPRVWLNRQAIHLPPQGIFSVLQGRGVLSVDQVSVLLNLESGYAQELCRLRPFEDTNRRVRRKCTDTQVRTYYATCGACWNWVQEGAVSKRGRFSRGLTTGSR